MSGLNFIQVQDSITAHIREEFPGYQVYDDVVVDDDFILKNGNKVKPYIVLNWGGLNKSGFGGSFVGARHDEYFSTVDIVVVAPTPRQARLSSNIIIDRLIGWKPQDSSPMFTTSGTDLLAVENSNGSPFVYAASTRMQYAINATNVGEYIQP
jgi:hypothetical protein